ncbi:MAG: viologen exporter family transport system permease protein, partial [Candidatus Eremiobacteraeota bacterium]|nr:viologen exporter family transport system permease protein [Candidatus Eremiobacteraeota bacterium]
MSLIRYAPAPRSLGEILAPYLAFAAKAFSREATYRMEVFTNVASLVVRLYLMKAVWTSLYAQNAAPAGVPLHAVLTYTVVALLMSLVMEIDGTRAIREKIREGTIATDLMKPISLPMYFFSDGIGQTLLHAVLVIPTLVLAMTLVHIDIPAPPVLVAFAFSFVLGYGVNFLLNFLMNSVAFWTLETFALQLMVRWVSDLLSGQIVPLIFFPGILQK